MFLEELKKLSAIQERTRIGEVVVPEEVRKRANRILASHLVTPNTGTFEDITNAVYAMGKAIRKNLCETKKDYGKVPKENRRLVRCRRQLKECRQKVARVSNEIHRKPSKRKLTAKERYALRTLRRQSKSKLENEYQLRMTKEKWLDQMRSKRVKLEKMIQKNQRLRENKMFEKSEGRFYRMLGGRGNQVGEAPEIDKFTQFWASIWESEERTTLQPWMEKVEKKIRAKVTNVKEFIVAESDIAMVIKKRKNWTAPGIDGIENFWWKIFKSCWIPLSRIMNC